MESKSALVLVNLGTPAAPTSRDVRQFLKTFLSDRRVVNLPRVFWYPLLYGIILPFRAPKVAKLYKKIWWPDGSPLKVITERQVQKLTALMLSKNITHQISYAMVYGEPSLNKVATELVRQGVETIVVLPLYPQFCSATTGSVCDQFNIVRKKMRNQARMELIKNYYDEPAYIQALAGSIKQQWQLNGKAEKLLFSFHGIPQSLIDQGDPYFQQCLETAKKVAECVGLSPDYWQVTFQSRFGRAEWAKPYTDIVIQEMAQQGIKNIDVITPAFASDCLETLEEIAVQNAKLFQDSGGKKLRLIPCLNDSAAHIAVLATLFERKLVK